MGIEDDFYATVKLKNGEEIFSKVAASDEKDRIMLILSNPITISELKGRNDITKYKVEPWLKTTSEDMFIINMEDVLTISESSDIQMIMMYQSFVQQSNREKKNQSKLNRKMGYISTVNDAKDLLEKLFKNS